MKSKRVRVGNRKRPVAPVVEPLEPRVLFSADVLPGFGPDLLSAGDDPVDDHDWSPPGEQEAVRALPELKTSDVLSEKKFLQNEAATLERTVSLNEIVVEEAVGYLSGDDGVLSTRELVFIDTRTPDFDAMVDDLRSSNPDADFEIIFIDSHEDGIEKIASVLALVEFVDALHIVSHGTGGAVQLGSVTLNAEVINTRSEELSLWSEELSEDADICLLYTSPSPRDGLLSRMPSSA